MKNIRRLSFKQALNGMLLHPWITMLAVLFVSAYFASCIPRLSFQTSIYDLIIEDLPETARYRAFKNIFGSDELIRVVVKADDIFDDITFAAITELSQKAQEIDGVRRVISLPVVKQTVDLSGDWDLGKFREVLSGIPLFQKNLYAPDGRSTVLTLVLSNAADPEAVIAAVDAMIADAPQRLSLYQIGMPLVSQALARLTQKDFFSLPPITFALIALVLLVLYRHMLHILLPLVCVALALIWNFGLMAVTGIPLSMLTMIVPVFLIAVGTAYCLHIVSEYRRNASRGASGREAAAATFAGITLPTVLATVTTLIGLASLLVNRITAIREFAVFACMGIGSFLVILLSFMPAAMAVMPTQKNTQRQRRRSFLEHLIAVIVRINLRHQKIALPIIGALVVFCIVGIFKVPVESNPVGYFKEETDISRHFHDIYQHLAGSFPINLTMANENADYFENVDHIADIAHIQRFMETLPGVDKTISFADYLMLVSYVSNGFDPAYYQLPAEDWELRMRINSYRSLLGDDMLNRFMSPDFSCANILLLTHISSSSAFLKTRRQILDFAAANFSRDIQWDVTGFGMVISESSHQLTAGQIKSLSITMGIVFGIMFLLFLSAKVGLIALVPNLFPIVVNFGIMGWLGIELSMFTSLIASIAIGLAVDDTIHYLVRYNREFRKDLDEKRALAETLHHIGRPIIFTTLTISIGFSILIFSNFKPTAIFGIMMALTMFSALIGDLILLPSLLLHIELVTLWDLIRLKLGAEPSYGIPLFKGLSRTQIHYIIMAGTIKRIEAGEVLFKKGDPSDSMCAIIAGSMDVLDIADGDAQGAHAVYKQINRLKTGDILGEMGLIRTAPRSATVVANEPSEYLEINLKMIQRLQWLYPPTANRFFFNLMTILCNRIEATTNEVVCQSIVDDLTGWYNRRGFVERLEQEYQRARRYASPLSLGLMRIDIEMNAAGRCYDVKDRNFRLLGHTLSALIRKSDALGRIDDRTFALIMPQTTFQQAEPVCRRLRDMLKSRRLDVDGLCLHVSLNISELDTRADLPAETLLAQSTAALFNKQKTIEETVS